MSENQGNGMGKRDAATYVLAASIFCLAGALVYFAYQASMISSQIPAILGSIEKTSEKVGPVVNEVAKIREQIPEILAEVEEVRKLVPPILEEVAQTRNAIPPILNEVAASRQTIPPILKESEQLRNELPAVLKSVDNVSWALVQTNKQLESYRPLAPEAINEIQLTREAIDPTLDRLDRMIERARAAGREASEGAVTGVFTGILAAPFRIVGGISSSFSGLSQNEAKYFSESELAEYGEKIGELLKTGKEGDTTKWTSNSSDARGEFTIKEVYSRDGRKCEIVLARAWKDGKRVVNKTYDLCLNDNNEWELQSPSLAD
jgi:ABC-type transporter Mla subunit MlaD